MVFLEDDADVLPLLVLGWVAIVVDIARDLGMDGMVAALYTKSMIGSGSR